MASRRRWLIIAHSFNVDGRAASLTITDKIAALMAAGIEPVVISAATGARDARFIHRQRLPWGPSGLRFDFRHIMQRRFGRGPLYRLTTLIVSTILLPFIAIERLLFGLSNQASWVIPATLSGLKLARTQSVELVYSSGGAASAHHAAAIIKSRLGIPWIAEVHDPMVLRDNADDDGREPRRTRNARYLQHMEQRICAEADCVWWFTEDAMNYARRRNPALDGKGFVVLPGANPPGVVSHHVRSDTLNLCHFGAVTEDRSLAPLLAAIHSVADRMPRILEHLRIHVYGSALDRNSLEFLSKTHIDELIVMHPRLHRLDAFKKMQAADVLLLLHGDYEGCSEYIPSKLYEYFWTHRPILALTNRNPFLDDLLAQHGAYVGHTLEVDSINDALIGMYHDWQVNQLHPQTASPISVDNAVARILARVEQLKPVAREDQTS